MKSFVLTKGIDRGNQSHAIGTRVYQYVGHDYGLARDDENAFNEPFVTVTLSPENGLPFFTAPLSALREEGFDSAVIEWTANNLINRPTAVYAK